MPIGMYSKREIIYYFHMTENRSLSCGTGGASGSCVYGLALIGAAIYYIQQATTFGEGVIGVLKAIVWPAILVYELLGFLNL